MSVMTSTYPPPPPTSNSLTSHQRHHLLRTTKKLGQVLGSTPRLVDDSVEPPSSERQSSKPKQTISTSMLRRGKSVSASSAESPSSSASASPRSTSSSHSANKYAESVNTVESWRTCSPSRLPPLLRLALDVPAQGPPSISGAAVSPALETIPASPPPPYAHTRTKSFSASRYTLTPPRADPYPADPAGDDPAFKVSSTAGRREKMERLRRTLGDGVPAELVFPDAPKRKSRKSSHRTRPTTAPGQHGGLYEPARPARDDASEVPLLKARRREERRVYSAKNLNEPVGFLTMGF
ncbi:hypothetical protein PLICRDRAFT_178713 [Plicaturopsis crispa FD-325 SS-3]|nr:hypothetical protein PLICRDRAFT_178713 [Plicaturopsis crispa FD-325 SS-3]